MYLWSVLPAVSFLALVAWENLRPAQHQSQRFSTADVVINLTGFLMQGVVVPCAGYLITERLIPQIIPNLKGTLQIGFIGAFILNFVAIDFLYYLQHRLFHSSNWLWRFHATHHHSPMVNVWATSRNAIVTNFFFVYLLVNPWFAFLCDSPDGFFAGAMVTAALDLLRHTNIHLNLPMLRGIFVLPQDHHRHHDADKRAANYGANLMIWDRLFGTAEISSNNSEQRLPRNYCMQNAPSLETQLFCPWRS